MKKNKLGWKSRQKYFNPDDEYYTSMKTAKLFLDPVIPFLKGKKVICPMDSENSNIYLYLKSKKVNVSLAPAGDGLKHNAFFVDYSKYDWVINNTAFSLIKKKKKKISECNWLLIAPIYLPHYAYFRPFLKESNWTKTMSISDWTNIKKAIPVRFVSNCKEIVWPKKIARNRSIKISLNKDYSIDVLNKKWDTQKYCVVHNAFGKYAPNFIFKKW